jgi:hypothetical protein
MVVRTLVKKGFDHLVYCEDDLFFSEYNGVYIGAVFDGCSTGIKSHFASSLYAKVLNRAWKRIPRHWLNEEPIAISRYVFFEFLIVLKEIFERLDLIDIEMVSTMIFCVIKDNKASFIVSGDGCIIIDGKHTKIDSPENAPDYLAYHMGKPFNSIEADHIITFTSDFNNDISICSDGIYSFTDKDKKDMSEEVRNSLLLDKGLIKSEAMLARKYNLLLKQGYSNYDDLSIVRFINESI